MNLRDIASDPLVAADKADPFDLLDLAGHMVVEALTLAAARRLMAGDIPDVLRALADSLQSAARPGDDRLTLHYLAAKLRELADDCLD